MAEIRWTPEQTRAVRSTEDTLLVANAGTGKTTTVVGKVLWLLGLPFGVDGESAEPLEPCPDPCELSEIAAITFTEKAAYDLKRQLRERIEASERADELRWEIDRASIGTIHSFCAELLREHALRLGIDPTFEVMDASEAWAAQDGVIRELVVERLEAGDARARDLVRDLGLDDGEYKKGAVGQIRDVVRDLRWHADRQARWTEGDDLDLDALRAACPEWDALDDPPLEACRALLALAREALGRWRARLEEENARDFDSLILDVRDLLEGAERDAALESIRRRYRILVIDEFQDTDFAQRDVAFAIGRGQPRPQLFLVGDPKQSIYAFRGADVSVWNEVESELRAGGGTVLDLSRNFRSDPSLVDFVNRVAGAAMEETGEALGAELPESRVRYAELEPARPTRDAAGVEWLVAEGENAAAQRDAEAHQVAARILELVGETRIVDPESGRERELRLRDVAVLYRSRRGLQRFEAALTEHRIPYFLAGAPHLDERQEVLDVLNALRLLRAPRDDLRAFGFLRSPFVGLRDESLARIRLLGRSGGSAPLLDQARRFLEAARRDGDGGTDGGAGADGGAEGSEAAALEDPASEHPTPGRPVAGHPGLPAVEAAALERGLAALDDLRELAPRLPLDELVEELLERTGYRLHLLLMDRAEETLANLQSLVQFAEAHRHLDVDAFLETWDRHNRQDTGLPQAPLYSRDDDVVTLSTIHRAKGLEWPVVFLVGVDRALWTSRSNEFWSDRELGPVLCPKRADRGPRCHRIHERARLESDAEEARLLYVAMTRARERLLVAGPAEAEKGYGAWLGRGVDGDRVEVHRSPGEVTPRDRPAVPDLSWLAAVEQAGVPAAVGSPGLTAPLPGPPLRWIRSATELMIAENDPEAWERRYRHGVQAPWEFAPEAPAPSEEPRFPATVRGSVIHGVLERIEEARELSRLLDETIGSLDAPEVEQLVAFGTDYRAALEEEIRRVVEGEEWRWYVEGRHWRELPFVHLAGERDWRFGAFDLYRLRDGGALVVDFKTHRVGEDRVEAVAVEYRVQARVYREAAACAGEVGVRLHFTGPNVAVEVAGSSDG